MVDVEAELHAIFILAILATVFGTIGFILLTKQLSQILRLLSRKAVKLSITFTGGLPNMPGTMTDTQSISASIAEQDAAGQPVAVDPTKITWTVGDSTIADLTQNPDGSASFKALAVGSTQVSVADSASGLNAQDTLSVTAGAATALVIKFGTPA